MRLRRNAARVLASIGFVVLLLIVGVGVVGCFFWPPSKTIANKVVLEIDFAKGFQEVAPSESVLGLLGPKKLSVTDTVLALRKASEDRRVLGLVARVGSGLQGLATVQELRGAVLSFRGKGKPAVAYSETFGEFGPGNNAYYLATAFDEVYLQPSGDLGLTGMIVETPFIKETLTKIGVSPALGRRCEYKSAVNTFTETGYTEAQEIALKAVVESDFGQMVEGIAKSRGLSEDEVRKLFDQGPFLSGEALSAKLVDGLLYRDGVYDLVRQKTDPSAVFLPIEDYWGKEGQKEPEEPVVAVIHGEGLIHLGKSGFSRLFGSVSMGSDTVAKAFRAAAEDERVKAVLFRVDSPGGSYVASDTIWREVLLTREGGKPVVVSMGDVAASGGYFVSVAASKIVAQPSTLTGSIGVFAGKAVTRDFWNKLGVTWDEIHTSDHSTLWSSLDDFTPADWKILQKWLDHVYEDFTNKVSESRGLALNKVQEAAKGRVWTGEQAKSLGLVDQLGGFPDALGIAKELAGIPAGTEVRLEVFPKEKTLVQLIVERLTGRGGEESSREDRSLELLASTARTIERLYRMAAAAGWLPGQEGLSALEAPLPCDR